MSTKVIYYGDILGLYILNKFTKTVKTELSQQMGYARASSFRSFLFRNQSNVADKKILDIIANIYGLNYFINILDQCKKDIMENSYKKSINFEDFRVEVIENGSVYTVVLVHVHSNKRLDEI